jgi:hypothetical protein
MPYREFHDLFPMEVDAIDYFIKIRYPDGATCPHWNKKYLVHHYRDKPKKKFQCQRRENHLSVFKGTIFEDTRTDIRN